MELFRFIILNVNSCSRTKVEPICLSLFLDLAICKNGSRTEVCSFKQVSSLETEQTCISVFRYKMRILHVCI